MSNLVTIGGAEVYSPATAISTAAIVADSNAVVAATPGLRLMGYSSKESAGVPASATFRIINGATGATNSPVVNVNHALSSSTNAWYGPDGISTPAGLSIDWLTGQVDVVLYYKVVN
jgi:hypothetical protein